MNASPSKNKTPVKASAKPLKAIKAAKPAAKSAKSVKALIKSVVKPRAAGSSQEKARLWANSSVIDIGIKTQDREKIAAGLARVLADTYSLYLKTHNFHWNVVGPMFNTLHQMFETQYDELALAVDLIAERIRAL
ncbi:MAG: hypothetical protein LBI31_04440, partial [Zoogloeaceae bacterium]|nr:hypothetical protein [Zoogloeaceae bacterium]